MIIASDDSGHRRADTWRAMDRPNLDRAYNNSEAVANSAAIIEDWQRRSAEVRARPGARLDLRYGDAPRNRIDYLSAGDGAPTLVFFHGGFWQARAKEDFAFVAAGPLALGISVALVGYTLAPDATLDAIVAESRAALRYLDAHLRDLGGDPAKRWLWGWSAGAHLVTSVLDHPGVRGGIAISGIYDLEPLRHCYVNDKLRLDEAAAERHSPLLHLGASSPPLIVAAGGAELPEMRRQSAAFAERRLAMGLPGTYLDIPGANHYTILDEFARPEGELMVRVRQMVLDDQA